MIRRLAAVLLAGILLLSCFACNGSDDDNTAEGKESPPVSQDNGNQDDSPYLEFDDDDDGDFLQLEDIPSLEWMFAEDDPADLRLSMRRDDDPPAGVNYPDAAAVEGDLVWFGALSWMVLEVKNGQALLLCEKLVDFRPYRYSDEPPDTWAESGVREWLNGAFYNGTFTDEEMAQIVETNLVNDDNQWFDTDGGADTADSVFLLSIEEVVRYFGDSGKLGNHTDRDVWIIYDDYNAGRVAQYIDAEVFIWWWLRSPGMNYTYAATVSIDGSINMSGDYVVSGGGGVRPAIWILL